MKENVCVECQRYENCGKPERIMKCLGYQGKCRNCKWHDEFSHVCFSGDSPRRADFTDNDYGCGYYKERIDDND